MGVIAGIDEPRDDELAFRVELLERRAVGQFGQAEPSAEVRAHDSSAGGAPLAGREQILLLGAIDVAAVLVCPPPAIRTADGHGVRGIESLRDPDGYFTT